MSEHQLEVVLVDDNSVVRELFKRSTKDMSVDLIAYSSANEAMSYLKENKPNLLFLDIIMPEKDGLTFLQELRRLPLHQDTFVIMITSKDYTQDRILAKEMGVMEFLLNPMSMSSIKDIILEYVNNDNPYETRY